MLKRILAGLIVAVVMGGAAVAGPFEDATAAYRRGDYATALNLFRPLAAQGDLAAQSVLGHMYTRGQGCPPDYIEAAKWYRLAAEQGDTTAQFSLGLMYDEGEGVQQDIVIAHMWLNLAASKDRTFTAWRDRIAHRMTPEQIAEAERLAREWMPTPKS